MSHYKSSETTVTIDNSMDHFQIQQLIDAQERDIKGGNLIFQFDNGTYTLDSKLDFNGFYNGLLYIYGDTTETDAETLHTSQNVHLNFSSASGSDTGINLSYCAAYAMVRNFKITILDAAGSMGIRPDYCLSVDIYYNYIVGAGTSTECSAIYCSHTATAACSNNYVSNVCYGINSSNSRVLSVNNDDTGTQPKYGINAQYAGVIGKSSTQPSGSTANENTSSGGAIR